MCSLSMWTDIVFVDLISHMTTRPKIPNPCIQQQYILS